MVGSPLQLKVLRSSPIRYLVARKKDRAMPERIIALSQQVSKVATTKVAEVRRVTSRSKILAVNAAIEAARAGEAGVGFGVVAQEINTFSTAINLLTDELQEQLAAKIGELTSLGRTLVS